MMDQKWTIKGFDSFSKGTFENGGQNLYVSKKGVLQRIWQFDVNKDGYVDLLIANSHAFNEHPHVQIISDPAGKAQLQEVLTQGSQTGAVADQNGNGFDDLIVGSKNDGHNYDLASYVYFGGKSGITENRKIELAASACDCCGVGDFNGDGRKEICYLISSGPDAYTPLVNRRLRIYRQAELGFRMNDYTELSADIAFFTVADIDGDGCDDLYCRMMDGKWLILWGSPDGFSMENALEVEQATGDNAYLSSLLPFGGGNIGYRELVRPKVLTIGGALYLFYADAEQVKLIPFANRQPGTPRVLPIPNIVSAAVGNIRSGDDLVLLQISGKEDQHVLVYDGAEGYQTPIYKLTTTTPRDVLLHDFSDTGRDDLVIVQGRNQKSFTTESLLYCTDEAGNIHPEPRRFETHNCVNAFAGDFTGCGKKSLVFINQQQSTSYGHIPVYVYLGSGKGYQPDNRLEFPGHSAGTMLPIDFNDDGWPDILVLHNAEDQPFLEPEADLYWGGPDGFSQDNKTQIKAPLAWGGHCADLNKDGYLDLISCAGRTVRISYGSEAGYLEENVVEIDVLGTELSGNSGILWPALADLNGNGWLDLVVPISYQCCSRIYWGGPEGYSNERSTLLPIERALTVRVADLNKDGYPDLIFGCRVSEERNFYQEGAVVIFWGGPDGYSGYNCCVLPSYQSNCITIADFNNDGWLDVFASSYFNKRERDINSYIYWNDHGNFSLTNRKRFFAHSSSAAWAGDFNEDGYVDLCLTHHRKYGDHRTESAVWWNGPEGFKEDNRTWMPTLGPHDMVPNDMGNVMTRGPEESYITPAGCVDGFTKVRWVGEIPVKTWVNCQLRTAKTPEELEAKPFIGADGTENTRFACGEAIPKEWIHGPYMQIKLYLGAVNSGTTPRITEITVE